MVDGAAESDAAYNTGSAISDQAGAMVSKPEPKPAPEKPAAKPVIIPMEGMPIFMEPKDGAEDSKDTPEPELKVEDYFFDVNGVASSEENLPDSPEQVKISSHPDAEMNEKESTSDKK